MKDIWVLREESGIGPMRGQTTNTYYAFENFEDAVKAFRHCLKKHALTDNELFDGDGHMKNISGYFDSNNYGIIDDKYLESIYNNLTGIVDKLREFFIDENCWMDEKDIRWHYEEDNDDDDADAEPCGEKGDWMFACKITYGDGVKVEMYGEDDGPCNGCAPYVDINCFDMSDPDREYHCFIEDEVCRDDDEVFGILKLQLKKAEIE